MSQIAQTILQQLGGNKFVAMTGASNLLGSDNGLSFKIGRNQKGVTHVRVTLTAMDDYIVEFLRIRGAKVDPVAFCQDIYGDTLARTVADKTGLALSL